MPQASDKPAPAPRGGALADAELAVGIARADKTAVARALNLIEDRRPESYARIERLLAALAPRAGVQRIGLTGPPGVGKSTLAGELARELRERGRSVGVLAVDPSSTRSGGALLGDRARMDFDPSDQGMFVRSLATAGNSGGLAYAANAVVSVLSAAYDRVLVETVGVGQSETDVEHVVDSVCVVVQPGSGDVIQFIKSGIMEIPDLLVVNKGDQALAQRAKSDLSAALSKLHHAGVTEDGNVAWQLPVLVTSARDRQGLAELADALERHLQSFTPAALAERRRGGAAQWALGLLARRYGEHALEVLGGRASARARVLALIDAGRIPLAAAGELGTAYLATIRGL
jgi:LAO/AO transport system kinase